MARLQAGNIGVEVFQSESKLVACAWASSD